MAAATATKQQPPRQRSSSETSKAWHQAWRAAKKPHINQS